MRAIEKKRPPLMNKRRWITLSVVIFILFVVSTILLYRTIQKDQWNEERTINAQVVEAGILSEIYSIEKYVWDDVYWMVFGKDMQEEDTLLVWADEQKKATVLIKEIWNIEQISKKIKEDMPDAVDIHIKPGVFQNALVWEYHYYLPQTDYYYYSFYSMKTGQFIETYTIPKKTRSQ